MPVLAGFGEIMKKELKKLNEEELQEILREGGVELEATETGECPSGKCNL